MGSWSGHVLPGSFFILLGLAWTIKFCYRIFTFKSSRQTRAHRCCLRSDMIEAVCKIFCSTFGLVIEQLLPWEPWFHIIRPGTEEFHNANNWQHSTMYAFFLLSGIADILVMKKPNVTPHCLNHLMMALAFGVEGFLFFFHTHGREELDVRLHVLLLFAIWPSSLVFLLLATIDHNENMAECYQMVQPIKTEELAMRQLGSDSEALLQDNHLNEDLERSDNEQVGNTCIAGQMNSNGVWKELNINNNHKIMKTNMTSGLQMKKIFCLQIITAVLLILQGTWFWQIAYVLYPPHGKPWEEDSHKNIAFITMFFTWHLLLAIIVVTTFYCILGCLLQRKKTNYNTIRNYSTLQNTQIP